MTLFLNIFVIFCIFVIGSLFGSFYSLATYRIPQKQDIVATRSYCPNCKHRLEFFDLIPVLSFILCGGKCRYCHDKISPRYFLLEVGHGLLFVAIYLILTVFFGISIEALVIFMCIAIMYSVIFVIIGSNIMAKKMNIYKKSEKANSKKGVFISELVIASILFTILLTTSFIVARNYTNKANNSIIRANAVSVGIKNAEIALSTKYDSLTTFTNVETVENIQYTTTVSVNKYSDENSLKEDFVKKITVSVKYNISGEEYEFKFDTLKGRSAVT